MNVLAIQPAIFQFLIADISLNVACKELKIAQVDQLFQLSELIRTYSKEFRGFTYMLKRKM